MNRIRTLITIGVVLLGASACTPQQIARVIDYSDDAVVVDVRPVDSSLVDPTAPCEGVYRTDVTEGADNRPVPCDAPPVQPTFCEGACMPVVFDIGEPVSPGEIAPVVPPDEGAEGAHR